MLKAQTLVQLFPHVTGPWTVISHVAYIKATASPLSNGHNIYLGDKVALPNCSWIGIPSDVRGVIIIMFKTGCTQGVVGLHWGSSSSGGGDDRHAIGDMMDGRGDL